MDRGAWWATVLGISESDTTEWLSTWTHAHPLQDDGVIFCKTRKTRRWQVGTMAQATWWVCGSGRKVPQVLSCPELSMLFSLSLDLLMTSLVAQMVKRLSTMGETRVWSLGWEDPWRRKWQPTPALLPGKSHAWSSVVGYMGSQRVRHDWATPFSTLTFSLGSHLPGALFRDKLKDIPELTRSTGSKPQRGCGARCG